MNFRVKRLADELRMRRRRLDVYRSGPDWPGKGPAHLTDQGRYDQLLVIAARMLEVPVPEEDPSPSQPLPAELRALIEDRLADAGLDVFAPRKGITGNVLDDGDLVL